MEHSQRQISDEMVRLEDELHKEARANREKVNDAEKRRAETNKELKDVYQSLWRSQSKGDITLQFMITALIWAFISTGFLVYNL